MSVGSNSIEKRNTTIGKTMLIQKFFTPGLAIISYIIYDEVSRRGAAIDPTRHIEQYLRYAQQENIIIEYILETHVHADFVSGAQEVKLAFHGIPKILCSGMGGQNWSPHYADLLIKDRHEINLGSIRLQAWHTPGHTPEHIIWIVYDDHRNPVIPAAAFTGDLIFVGSIGRPDLLGPETQEELSKQLYQTLFQTLKPLPDFLEIYPAHGAGSLCGKGMATRQSSTLGYERQSNPWLKLVSYDEWKTALLKDMPAIPEYFKEMKKVNITGIDVTSLPHSLPPLLTLDQTLKLMPTSQIIDGRNPEAFARGHLKGAINIPVSASFITWAGSILPLNQEYIIVVANSSEALFVVQSLKLIGINSIKGVCDTNTYNSQEWQNLQHASPTLTVEAVAKNKDNMYVLDVRTPGEWDQGHIENAHHIEMARINSLTETIPKNSSIAVFCHSGTRACIIASLLQNYGFSAAFVRGGMQEWIKSGLPINKKLEKKHKL